LANIKKYEKGPFINDNSIDNDAEKMKKLLDIRISNFKVNADTLSGGNQQKLVLAKWLVGNVRILIMDEPTRGIDVGAKAEIHRLMDKFTHEGMAIIMISSELPEIIGMSDRVAVMNEGRLTGIIERENKDDAAFQEEIMRLATAKSVGAQFIAPCDE
jgi:inositol transport system ATP-binding protein